MTEIKVTREFEIKLQKAFENIGKSLVAEMKKKAGNGDVADSYRYKADENGVEVYSDDVRALYLEYGTGERGDKEFKQYSGEPKPKFTKPIKAVEKKVLHWKMNGKEVFAHSTKGMSPKAPLRETMLESREVIKKGFREAFK